MDTKSLYERLKQKRKAYGIENDNPRQHPHPGILKIEDYTPAQSPISAGELCERLGAVKPNSIFEVYMYNTAEKRFYHADSIFRCQLSKFAMKFVSTHFGKEPMYTKSSFDEWFGCYDYSLIDKAMPVMLDTSNRPDKSLRDLIPFSRKGVDYVAFVYYI